MQLKSVIREVTLKIARNNAFFFVDWEERLYTGKTEASPPHQALTFIQYATNNYHCAFDKLKDCLVLSCMLP